MGLIGMFGGLPAAAQVGIGSRRLEKLCVRLNSLLGES
jgi:hypothetical protein